MGEIYTVQALNEEILNEATIKSYLRAAIKKLGSVEDIMKLINKLVSTLKGRSKAEIAAYLFSLMLAAGPVSTKLVELFGESRIEQELVRVAQEELAKAKADSTFAATHDQGAATHDQGVGTPVSAVRKPFAHFLDAIAHEESTNNPRAINKYGYMGKYQFGTMALRDVVSRNPKLKHLLNITPSAFRRNPDEVFPEEQQDEAMKQLLKNNWHYIRKFHDHVGQEINGIKLDKSGLLAGAHLVGNKGLRTWLSTKGETDPSDANGEHVSTYVKKFSGYQVDL